MGLFDRLQAKLELYRLEQKYTQRKHRSVYSIGARYRDGEYFYVTESPAWEIQSGGSSPTSSTKENRASMVIGAGWGL